MEGWKRDVESAGTVQGTPGGTKVSQGVPRDTGQGKAIIFTFSKCLSTPVLSLAEPRGSKI